MMRQTMKLLSRQKIVLCVNPQQMVAGVWSGKRFHQHQQFAHDDIGVPAFDAFLKQHAQAVFYLICNVSEEDYQRQLLPHSTGGTQKTLLARKLSQAYRGLTFSAAIQQGREQSASKKDIVLFAAIRDEQCLQPWLQMLQKSGNAIAGVYLLPMLSEQLLESSIAPPQPTEHLLLCERLSSGLQHSYWRHSYFHHGRLCMSRLLTHTPNTQDTWSNFHDPETEKSRLNLISQRLLDADTPLHITLLDDSHLEKLAKQLHLPLPALIEIPELAHMQRLINDGKHAKLYNLAPRTLTQKFYERRTSLKLSVVTFFVLLLCAAISIYCLEEGRRLATETKFLRTQLAHAQQGFSKLQQHSNPLIPKAGHIKNAVAAAQQLEATPLSPLRMMQVLSTSFANMGDAAPSIQLESLDWSLNIAETAAEPPIESAFISLTAGDESTLQHYIALLRQHPQVASAAITSTSPTGIQPTIQGSTTADENAAQGMPRFQISVTLKPKHEREPR